MSQPDGGSSGGERPLDAADRVATSSVESYAFEAFRIDLGRRQLVRDGQPVALGLKTFDTLVLLIRHRDRVVGKDEIISAVWPDSFVSEDSLTQSVSALRRVLCDDPSQPKFIATVARRGYRFIAPVTEVRIEEAPAPQPPAEPVAPAPPVPVPAPVLVEGKRGESRLGVWVLVGVAAILLLAGAAVRFSASSSKPTLGPLHFVQDLPAGITLASGGFLSPDSRYLVFVARDENSGKTQLWCRSLDAPGARAMDGTEGASRPFWSPDSQFIAFFSGSKIKRIGVASGPPQTLAPTVGARPAGGTWGTTGVILYADLGSLFSIPATGGTATTVLVPDAAAQDVGLRAPQFLPDGRHFLYVVSSANPDRTGTYVGALDSSEKARLLDGSNSSATFTPPGYLTYVREHVLLSQLIDLARFELTGGARTLAGNVSANPDVSASSGGLLAFGGGTTAERLLWFDRSGQRTGAVDVPTVLHNLALSPDHKQLLGTSTEPNQVGVWLVDLDRGAPTRLVPGGGAASWSPDGAEIAFTVARAPSAGGIYLRATAGRDTDDELALKASDFVLVNDWSRDGQYVVYVSANLRTKNDLWVLPRFGDRKPIPFLQTPANEIQAQVSPDGRWIAYASDESGSWEVYVDAFPKPGAKRTISTGGGTEPQWRGDGKELFYLSPDHMMMAVDVSAGTTLRVSKPNTLFRAPVLGSLSDYRNYYAATADGRRFLIDSVAAGSSQEPITVLVNWTEFLR